MGFFDRFRFASLATPKPIGQQVGEVRVDPPPKGPTPKEMDTIVSFELSTFGGGQFPRYNPDDLVGQKGLRIYTQMRNDEQVKAVCTFKRDAILSAGYKISYDDDDKSPLSKDEQTLRVRVIEEALDRMDGSFIDTLNMISTGREYGFSLTEKVYTQMDLDGKTWIGITKMLGRDPTTFRFVTDPWGELVRLEQIAAGHVSEVELRKFILYVHNPEFDRWFGRSDLRAAYRSWFYKDALLRYWSMGLEKLGGGMLVGNFAADAQIQPGTPAYRALQDVFTNAKASPSILLPHGVTAQVVFPTTMQGYEQAIQYHDLAIAKALLVPNLLGLSQAGRGGSFAQSQTQIEAFAWALKADSDRLESCINEQLIRDLGDQNWGDGEYPDFAFSPISEERLKWALTTWGTLLQWKGVIATEEDEARIREILGMPPRDETSTPLVDPAVAAQQISDQNELKSLRGQVKQNGSESSQGSGSQAGQTQQKVLNKRHDHRKPKSAKFSAALAKAVERVNFSVIDKKQATLAKQTVADLANQVARTVMGLIGNDAHLASILKSVSGVASMQFSGADVGRLQRIIRSSLVGSWQMGTQMSTDELSRAKGARMTARFTRFTDIRDRAAEFFDTNSYRMAGNVSDGARAMIQQELQNGIKYGKSPTQIREAIWSRLQAKGFTTAEAVKANETDAGVLQALDTLWVDTEEAAAAYLDTLVRTNVFEAMNEARYAEFTDPALADFIMALRYSAILDDRTTEICQALDGDTWAPDNPLWDEYRPPNHYNCRSLLIPVTTEDGWDGIEDDAPPNDIQPAEGFH